MRPFKGFVFVSGIMILGLIVNITFSWKDTLFQTLPLRHDVTSQPVRMVTVNNGPKVNWSNYSVVVEPNFYIYSVLAAKSARNRTWDLVVVNGWEAGRAHNDSYKCCFFDDKGNNVFANTDEKRKFVYHSDILGARQVVCKIPPDFTPTTFSLLSLFGECNHGEKREIIVYPEPQNSGKFGVCGKIVYGNKDPSYLIEWIEYQKYLKADKIVLYPYQDLNRDALRVLKFYSVSGVIEIVPYPFAPQKDKLKRHFPVQGQLMWNDEQVPMFDAQERLREYDFFTVIDTDEFVAPNKSLAKTYTHLMEYLLTSYPNGANFPMLSHFHALDWNKTAPFSDLMLSQFGNRSQSISDRVKLLHVSDRIVPGTLWIHDASGKPGYHKAYTKDWEVVFKHYRMCGQEWLEPSPEFKPNKCFGGFNITNDPYMTEIVAAIGPNVRKTMQILGLRPLGK